MSDTFISMTLDNDKISKSYFSFFSFSRINPHEQLGTKLITYTVSKNNTSPQVFKISTDYLPKASRVFYRFCFHHICSGLYFHYVH